MVSAGFAVDKKAQKENGTDTKLTHTQAQAHTCPSRHMLGAYTDTPRQTHRGLCSDTDGCLQMPVDTLYITDFNGEDYKVSWSICPWPL